MSRKVNLAASLDSGFAAGRETPTARPPATATPAVSRPAVSTGTYRDLVKRDTKIHPEQDRRLKDLENAIRADLRARGVKPERRITINTLIRVALEDFLDAAENVRGDSEADLLASLRAARANR